MFVNERAIRTRTLIIVLALAWSLAGRVYGFAGGTGEPNDPYQIATIEDLLAVGSSTERLTKHYILVNDLDLDPNLPGGRVFDDALIAGNGVDRITGKSLAPFSGVLDGAGHAIRNLCVSCEHEYGVGLFGYFAGRVEDLSVLNVQIDGSSSGVGAIAGFSSGGTILHCSTTGQVSGSIGAGGIVGHISDGTLVDCRTDVQVRGDRLVGGLLGGSTGGMASRCTAQGQVYGNQYVGGLGGHLAHCFIVESRATGKVSGIDDVGGLVGYLLAGVAFRCAAACEVDAEQTAGGLIGTVHAMSGASITDCCAQGSVAGSSTGGLVGIASGVPVLNSYAACEMIPLVSSDGTPATVGGLLGEANYLPEIRVTNCLWDGELSGIPLGAGSDSGSYGTGLTTEQMQQQGTFEQAGWDLDTVWTMQEDWYPILQWERAADGQ